MAEKRVDSNMVRRLNRVPSRLVRAPFNKSAEDQQLEIEKAHATFSRQANDISLSSGSGMANVSRTPLMYIDPMFDPILLMFPKENIKELNRRLRHYYSYHPIVNNIIDLHSSYSLSDFELRAEDPEIEKYYNTVKEKLDLLTLMINLNRDFWLLGNGYLYGNWDETNLEWLNFNQYPPENVEVHRTYVGAGAVYYLKADEELKKILTSTKEVDKAIANLIPTEFKDQIKSGKPYLLSNQRLIHFARRPSAYSLIGESALKPCLKDLLYEDKLRLLQYTFVDRHMFPIIHWKVGSAEKGWIPSKKHFDALEAQLIAASNDPAYNLITHPYVNVEYHSAQNHKQDLKTEFEFTQKRIMMGLFASDGMLGSDAGPYATTAVNMKVVMHRYLMNRTMLENLLRQKMFTPLAKARGFVRRTTAELKHNVRTSAPDYILPKFFYVQRLNLLSSTQEQEMLLRMRDKGEIPMSLIADVFGWDVEQLKSKFASESSTVLDPAYREAKKDVLKDAKVRNQVLRGKKLSDIELPEQAPETKTLGRPTIPEDKKVKPEPAIISPGGGESSPRSKQQEKGVVPAPKEVREAPLVPASETTLPVTEPK